MTEFAHESLEVRDSSADAVEKVWREFWLPTITMQGEDGRRRLNLAALKGELFDCHHLIMTAPKVYRLVTGGITDDPCASYEGIRAEYERVLAEAVAAGVREELRRRGIGQ